MAILTQITSTPTSSSSPTSPTCNIILEQLTIQDGGEVIIQDPVCVEVVDGDAGRQMLVSSTSTVTYS